MTAIELEDVFRIYDTPQGANVALQGLTLSVAPGEIVVVLGPSGSGKSTLLRIAAGLERPTAGTARVLGLVPASLRPRAAAAFRSRHLGVLDQHYARSLSPELTCLETVGLRLALLGVPARERHRRATDLLERVGLGERARDRPAALSGGEQQRVAVCAALVHGPELLLVDEPGGELDAASAREVYRLLAELVRTEAATALVVSHDPEAAAIADRLLTIRDGRLGEEREAGGDTRLVVGRGGWLRLPEAARREVGIGDHAVVRAVHGAVVVEPAGVVKAERAERERAAAPAPGQVVAELRRVDKRFGERLVLEALETAFRSGRLSLVTGRSGSGKTTLLNLLAGLERPSGGDVVVLGQSLVGRSRAELARFRRAHVGVVGQEPGLVPFLSSVENVALALELRGRCEDSRERARAALVEVGLGERLETRVDRLSAGERQRVAIARALAPRPRLVLADEPTARLDEENARAVADLLLRLARAHDVAVVCATHDPSLVEVGDDRLELDSPPSGVSRRRA